MSLVWQCRHLVQLLQQLVWPTSFSTAPWQNLGGFSTLPGPALSAHPAHAQAHPEMSHMNWLMNVSDPLYIFFEAILIVVSPRKWEHTPHSNGLDIALSGVGKLPSGSTIGGIWMPTGMSCWYLATGL